MRKAVARYIQRHIIVIGTAEHILTQIGPRGSILPLEISGCLTTLVSLRHVIWISNHSASFGEAIRQKIYAIQCLFFRKLVFENA